jgi:CitB family two-component system response regulator MalR
MIRTLIVEDDPMVAEINRRYLEKIAGFELVMIASSVEEAIPTIENEELDLILLDIYMQGDDGWSLLSKIRGLGREIDIIVISAACDKYSIQKGLRFGVVDYLIKPFEFERFYSALTSYKEEFSFMSNKDIVKQSDLDQLFFHRDNQTAIEEKDLPKGLTKSTLKKVWEKIVEIHDGGFSTDEIAQKVGISRVSMRKYLYFLADIGIIESELMYGTIGRPVYLHRIINLNEEIIHKYLG